MSQSLLTLARRTTSSLQPAIVRSSFSTIRMASSKLDSQTISNITSKESEITGSSQPVKGGPTAQTQKHVGEEVSGAAVSDIVKGEMKITGESGPRQGGPASTVQSQATQVRCKIEFLTS